ncbi:hypothetical protein K432DRAFT_425907 [Lepidopterella palustris CBS 459.81]|uniref:Uncharacterized protein n=1 Tax=Lepidopterella palustris CBS 459.81 TaxID=1314670 RepID=A0A8E2JFQ0_9PEZI|nr:hypothetical protein K432DRAFT_425907 [Lepidopterella palustris CBS 459.81]
MKFQGVLLSALCHNLSKSITRTATVIAMATAVVISTPPAALTSLLLALASPSVAFQLLTSSKNGSPTVPPHYDSPAFQESASLSPTVDGP